MCVTHKFNTFFCCSTTQKSSGVGLESGVVAGLDVAVLESDLGDLDLAVGDVGEGETSLGEEFVDDVLGAIKSKIDLQVQEEGVEVADVGLDDLGGGDLSGGQIEEDLVGGAVEGHVAREGKGGAELDGKAPLVGRGRVGVDFANDGEVEGHTVGDDVGGGVSGLIEAALQIASSVGAEVLLQVGEDGVKRGGGELDGEVLGERLLSDVVLELAISVEVVQSGVEDVLRQEDLDAVLLVTVVLGEGDAVLEGDLSQRIVLGVDGTVQGHVDVASLEDGGGDHGVVQEEELRPLEVDERVLTVSGKLGLVVVGLNDGVQLSGDVVLEDLVDLVLDGARQIVAEGVDDP